MTDANSANQTKPELTLYVGEEYVKKAESVGVLLTGLHKKVVNKRDATKFVLDLALEVLASTDPVAIAHYELKAQADPDPRTF